MNKTLLKYIVRLNPRTIPWQMNLFKCKFISNQNVSRHLFLVDSFSWIDLHECACVFLFLFGNVNLKLVWRWTANFVTQCFTSSKYFFGEIFCPEQIPLNYLKPAIWSPGYFDHEPEDGLKLRLSDFFSLRFFAKLRLRLTGAWALKNLRRRLRLENPTWSLIKCHWQIAPSTNRRKYQLSDRKQFWLVKLSAAYPGISKKHQKPLKTQTKWSISLFQPGWGGGGGGLEGVDCFWNIPNSIVKQDKPDKPLMTQVIFSKPSSGGWFSY